MQARRSLRMVRLAVGATALLLAVAPAFACGSGKILFEDDFATLDPAWGRTVSDSFAPGPSGLQVKLDPGSEIYTMNQGGLYDNFQICMKVSFDFQAGDQPYFGLAFWGVDNLNLYAFTIAPPTGTYALWREQNGRWLKPIPWTATTVLKQESGAANELSITVSGRHGTVEVNGQKLVEFNGQVPDGGGLIGMDLALPKSDKTPKTFVIKRIEVRALPAAP